MKYEAIFQILKTAYSLVLRDLLAKAVESSEEEWDDYTLKIMDSLFGYVSEDKK